MSRACRSLVFSVLGFLSVLLVPSATFGQLTDRNDELRRLRGGSLTVQVHGPEGSKIGAMAIVTLCNIGGRAGHPESPRPRARACLRTCFLIFP